MSDKLVARPLLGTTQHIERQRTNIYARSGIRTRDLDEVSKIFASDGMATGTTINTIYIAY
jgi:hypothetical protein